VEAGDVTEPEGGRDGEYSRGANDRERLVLGRGERGSETTEGTTHHRPPSCLLLR
jgi:hypothetical protein